MLNLAAISFKLHVVMVIAIPSYVQSNQFCEARFLCTALQSVSVVTCSSLYCHLSCSESCVCGTAAWQAYSP